MLRAKVTYHSVGFSRITDCFMRWTKISGVYKPDVMLGDCVIIGAKDHETYEMLYNVTRKDWLILEEEQDFWITCKNTLPS